MSGPDGITRRKALQLAVATVVVGGGALGLARNLGDDPTRVPNRIVGAAAPALSGPDLDGGTRDLSDLLGQVVLVNVWASWCAPCRVEYPVLSAAMVGLADAGLAVLGINTQDSEDEARAFAAELGVPAYPSVLDPAGDLAVLWGTSGVPETFVVDRTGTVVTRRVGEVTAAWIDSEVVPLLDA